MTEHETFPGGEAAREQAEYWLLKGLDNRVSELMHQARTQDKTWADGTQAEIVNHDKGKQLRLIDDPISSQENLRVIRSFVLTTDNGESHISPPKKNEPFMASWNTHPGGTVTDFALQMGECSAEVALTKLAADLDGDIEILTPQRRATSPPEARTLSTPGAKAGVRSALPRLAYEASLEGEGYVSSLPYSTQNERHDPRLFTDVQQQITNYVVSGERRDQTNSLLHFLHITPMMNRVTGKANWYAVLKIPYTDVRQQELFRDSDKHIHALEARAAQLGHNCLVFVPNSESNQNQKFRTPQAVGENYPRILLPIKLDGINFQP